jgi:hypothetical protein
VRYNNPFSRADQNYNLFFSFGFGIFDFQNLFPNQLISVNEGKCEKDVREKRRNSFIQGKRTIYQYGDVPKNVRGLEYDEDENFIESEQFSLGATAFQY